MQFIQLLFIDRCRCIEHDVAAAVVFWKGNEVANAFASSEDGAKPVKSKGYPPVWRCTVFKGTQQESEFVQGFFSAHAQCSKHFFLKLTLVDADRTTPNLVSVQHHIVCICLDGGIRMLEVLRRVFYNGVVLDHDLNMRGF